MLCPMPRDTAPTMNRQTKKMTENQRFVKLKEVQADTQSQRFCTTFNFTPTHQAHPLPNNDRNFAKNFGIRNRMTKFAKSVKK